MEQIKETKQTKKELQVEVKPFIALKDLTAEDVKGFKKIPFTFKIETTKKGKEIKTIAFELTKKHLKAVAVMPGGERLTQDRFDLINLSIELPENDTYGRPMTEWHRNVPVRFVRGKTKNETEYHALEIVYKQFMYDTHFFNANSDQYRMLQMLESKGLLKIDWIDRPDKIDDLSFEDLSFTE
jgi:hypothetical protein